MFSVKSGIPVLSIGFPGKLIRAPTFWDSYLPSQETCLSVVSWREGYAFNIFSIATSKSHTELFGDP